MLCIWLHVLKSRVLWDKKKKKKKPTWNNILYYLNGEKAKQFFKDIL